MSLGNWNANVIQCYKMKDNVTKNNTMLLAHPKQNLSLEVGERIVTMLSTFLKINITIFCTNATILWSIETLFFFFKIL